LNWAIHKDPLRKHTRFAWIIETMNDPLQRQRYPETSSRERSWFLAVSAVIGLVWGALGLGIQVLLLRGPVGFGLPEGPAISGVMLGMALGTAHAGHVWLARRSHRNRGAWPLEALVYGSICVALGILWGSVIVLVMLPFGTEFKMASRMLYLIPVYGAVLGAFSVLTAAIMMAPLTVLAWNKTLERLESQRVVSSA
jgi:hypothetical protein